MQAKPVSEDASTAILTFLIADVRGYTLFTAERGDEAAAKLAARFAAVAREVVEARGGAVIELRGDEALAVFDSARQAIRAAVDLQRRFVDETVTDPALPLPVGIGLDAGEAVPVEGGYRGGALNLAARLCGLAGPAEILASREVVHLARKVDGVTYVDRGSFALKGLTDPVHVIRLRAEADDAAEDTAFRRALGPSAARLTPIVPGVVVPNPYKGLRPFEEADAPDFFGREELTQQLVNRLGETRFLAVVGPSGSGKSSVVRAGLIPALRRGRLPGSSDWRIVEMFPGAHPHAELEAALLRVAVNPPSSLIEQLERDDHGLLRAAKRVLPADGSELVLLIDQFEEVFTLVEDEAVRTHFLESLEAALTEPHSRLRVVATLRADFYDRPLLYRGFAELLRSRVEAVVPLSPAELERAISGPAKRVDARLEHGLVAQMLADVAHEPGGLPLLQYALTELFERRDDSVLTLEVYRGIGGVSGALGRRAEELYGHLDSRGSEAARQLFLRLVALGEGTEDTRRPVLRSELVSLEVDQQAMAAVIDSFGASRLLSFDRDSRTGAPTVEVAHEALLTAWGRLRRWIDEAREDLRTERRLALAAREWLDAARDRSFLASGSRLEQFDTLRQSGAISITPLERDFLSASAELRDREAETERERTDRERAVERRSLRRARALVAVLAAAALVAGTLTAIATREQNRAEREARIATAQRLAAESVASLETNPELAILLALEAVETTYGSDGTVLAEADEALHRAVHASRVVISVPGHFGVAFHPDGDSFVTNGTDGSVTVWDATTGDEIRTLSGHTERVNNVAFSADGRVLATASEDGTATVWDASTGEEIRTVRQDATLLSPALTPDGSLLAVTGQPNFLSRDGAELPVVTWLYETSSGEELLGLPGGPGLAFSPDGALFAHGGAGEGAASIWKSGTMELVRSVGSDVIDVAFSPDGALLATAQSDDTARVWKIRTGKEVATFSGHTASVEAVDFSPDGRVVASSSLDGTVRLWDLASGRSLLVLAGQGAAIENVDFSLDGSRVLAGSSGGTALVWDVTPSGSREVITISHTPLFRVAASPDGTRLLTGGFDGAAHVFDAATGDELLTIEHGEPVLHATFSADGSTIATAGVDGSARLWRADTGEPLHTLDHLGGQVANGIVSSVAFAPDGTRLVTVGFGAPKLWDVRTGDHVGTLFGHVQPLTVFDAAFSPDGSRIVTSSQDETARVWDANTGDELFVLDGHSNNVIGTAFSPDGTLIATGSVDGTARLWDAETGEEMKVLRGHAAGVNGVAFSPDGSMLATAGQDRTTRIWDPTTGRQLLTLYGHTAQVHNPVFLQDGGHLATAGEDGTIRVYTLSIDELLALARERVTRTFTNQECRQYQIDQCPA